MAKEVQEFQAKLTAKDDASKVIDEAAKKADKFAGEEYEAELSTKLTGGDKLKADIAEILHGADDVEQADPKLTVTVDGADKAAGQLRDVGDAADHAGERADAQTGGLRDISGALGDIGGAGLDAADGLIGMGETIGQVAPKLAPLAGAMGQIGLAIGVGSLLYAGLQALPGLLGGVSEAEKIAEQSTKDLTKAFLDGGPSVKLFNEHLVELLANNPETVQAMKLLGVSAQDISRAVNGETSPAIDNARKFLQAYREEAHRVAEANANGATTSNNFAEKMGLTEQQAIAMAEAAKKVIATTDGETQAMQTATQQADDYNAALQGLPGRVPIEIIASDGGSLQSIIDRLHEIERTKWTVDVKGNIHVGAGGAMAGTPYAPGGPMRVGEAGPETVWLPRGSRVDTAGRTMMAGGAATPATVINNYISVTVPVGTPTAEVGRYVADALDAHERRSGSRRRVA